MSEWSYNVRITFNSGVNTLISVRTGEVLQDVIEEECERNKWDPKSIVNFEIESIADFETEDPDGK